MTDLLKQADVVEIDNIEGMRNVHGQWSKDSDIEFYQFANTMGATSRDFEDVEKIDQLGKIYEFLKGEPGEDIEKKTRDLILNAENRGEVGRPLDLLSRLLGMIYLAEENKRLDKELKELISRKRKLNKIKYPDKNNNFKKSTRTTTKNEQSN